MNIHELWNKHFYQPTRTWSEATARSLDLVHAELAAEGADLQAVAERNFGSPFATWPPETHAAIAGFRADLAKPEVKAEPKQVPKPEVAPFKAQPIKPEPAITQEINRPY